jgi:hypothetical protein
VHKISIYAFIYENRKRKRRKGKRKNGLAFVEVLLARKVYFGKVGFLPFFRSYNFRRIGSLFS